MAEEVTPLAAAYRNVITPRTVLIERFYKTADGKQVGDSGSGVIIGNGSCFGPQHINIATAAHVLDDPETQEIRWCISRVEQELDGQRGLHIAEFVTTKPITDEPMLFRPSDPEAFDIGMISMFNVSRIQGQTDGATYPFIDLSRYPLVKTTPFGHLLPGTKVGWCGFPGFVHDITGSYDLCYYEGVVSAYVSGRTSPLYLVDGHAANGVSGGPIWFSGRDSSPIVLGVVSSYVGPGGDVPGLCAFTPMNVLFDHLEGDPRYSHTNPDEPKRGSG